MSNKILSPNGVIKAFTTRHGHQLVVGAVPVAYQPTSRGAKVEFHLSLMRVKPEWGEIDEQASELVSLDYAPVAGEGASADQVEALWLEAMLSWGDRLAKVSPETIELDDETECLVGCCLEGSSRARREEMRLSGGVA